jgi:hypothetical protein
MVYKYKSVKAVLEGLYRDLGITEEVNFLDVIEWCGESLESIGAFSQYQQKTECLTLCDYRAPLPCDFHKMQGVNIDGCPLVPATSQYGNILPDPTAIVDIKINNQPVTFPARFETGPTALERNTYLINDNFIITNLKDGELTLSYIAIPTDDEGFPLIPDNYYYLKAIKAYVTFMLDRIGWRTGRVADKVFKESQADWQWYTQAARSAGMMPNIDIMESFKNQWVRLMPKINQYDTHFQHLGQQEMLKKRL